MSLCRTKLNAAGQDEVQSIIHVFDSKLEGLVKQVEKLQKKSAKANDVENLMAQIEDLRRLSVNARLAVGGQQPTSGRSHSIEAPVDGMRRQPSVESVNSCYAKGGKEKAGGFGRNAKKGWVSCSITFLKFTTLNTLNCCSNLHSIKFCSHLSTVRLGLS